MSSNYLLMKESKKELLDAISSFFEHIVNINTKTYEFLTEQNYISNDALEEITFLEERSDFLYDDVLNSSIWIIQKNQPRAENLRFVISCINSAKELERASDYIILIAKFLNKRKLDKKEFDEFIVCFKKCIDILKIALELFLQNDLNETKKEIKELLKEYEFFMKNHIRQTILLYSNSNETITEEQNKIIIELTIAFSNLEKIVNHIYNVIKAFNYINLK